ncbi:polysaccharide biosynthesis/export family protein [Aureimonas populi]|uniref:Polysaccharide biosynthesis/export family protein n=1 Tax=Aureimonas populi TaxID=1701758 RepID=A0ABW5CNW7_9HYPH|nr:polysaccharide biosynthesis/export family protein [Aureimonas populi]
MRSRYLGEPATRPQFVTRRSVGLLSSAFLALSLAGCVPSNGPLTAEVLGSAANRGAQTYAQRPLTFDAVDVDQEVAAIAAEFWPGDLQSAFGVGSGSVNPTLGVGDTLEITIFEAGPDGLFSTTENRSSTLTVTVQPDGSASIPYVGSFRFNGKTLEGARREIVSRLEGRAVEPDVILTLTENSSRVVSVNGSVGSPSPVPLGLRGDRLMEVLAKAGGPSVPSHDAIVRLTRGGVSREVPLQAILNNPGENIYAQPGDQIFVSARPRMFSVLGSAGRSARLPFETDELNVIEAASLAGGAQISLADPQGYFVFRYEYPSVVEALLGAGRIAQLKQEGMLPDRQGRYPIVYRFDLSDASSYLVGQKFMMRDGDVLYVARHRSADFLKFISLITSSTSFAGQVAAPL